MSQYPEHDRLAAIADVSQDIGGFLEWLQECYILAPYGKGELRNHLFPADPPIESLLAEYFQIDRDKLEAERRHAPTDQGGRRAAGQPVMRTVEIPETLVRTMFRYLFWMYLGYLLSDWTMTLFGIR